MTTRSTIPTTPEQAVLDADDLRIRALIHKDFGMLDKLHADDLVYVHSTAAVDEKHTYLASLEDEGKRFLHIEREDARVRLWGTSAMIDGKVHIDVQVGGQQRRVTSRFVGIWVCRDGRWQLAHHQSTSIAPVAVGAST